MVTRPYNYWRRVTQDQPYGLLPADRYFLVGPLGIRHPDDLLVRTRAHVEMRFSVGNPASDSPSSRWWSNCSINYCLAFDPAGGTPHLLPFAEDKRIKLTGSLEPILYPDPTDAGAYNVCFRGFGEDIDSKGIKAGDGTHLGKPELTIYLQDHDAGWSLGIYSAIDAAIFTYVECLFETSVPP